MSDLPVPAPDGNGSIVPAVESEEHALQIRSGSPNLAVPLVPYGTPVDPLNNPSHSAHHASLHNAIVEIDTALSGGAGWNAGTAATAAGDGILATGTVLSVDLDNTSIVFDAGVSPAKKIQVGTITTTQVSGLDAQIAAKADKVTAVTAGPGLTGTSTLAGPITFAVNPGLGLTTASGVTVDMNRSVVDTWYPPLTTTISAGQGLTGGGTLAANMALDVGAGAGIIVGVDSVALDTAYTDGRYVTATRTVTAGQGLTGGGDLTVNRIVDVGAGTGISVSADFVALDTTYTDGRYVPGARTLTAGQGLTGGGDLTADRNLDVGAGTGITVSADFVALDTTYTDGRYVQGARTLTAGQGLTGGGDLTANRNLDVGAGIGITVSTDTVALDTVYTNTLYPPVTRSATAGPGLIGGGTLAADISFTVGAGTGIQVFPSTDPGGSRVAIDAVYFDTTYLKKANDTATGNLSMGGFHINNLVDSGLLYDHEAAPVWYVDQRAMGVDLQAGVRLATSIIDGVLNLAAAPATIDGVAPVVGDRILVKNQWDPVGPGDRPAPGDGVGNGIYTYPAAAGQPLVRAGDASVENDLRAGSAVFVEEGTVNGKVIYLAQTYEDQMPWTPDVDDTFWHQYSSRLELQAGAGLTMAGNEISTHATPEATGSNGIDSITVTPVSLHVTDGGIGTVKLKDGAVTAPKLNVSIDAMSDVDTTTAIPTTGQTLAWNGAGNWVPGQIPVTASRVVFADNGLTGGGSLSADVHLAVGAGTGIVVSTDAVSLDTAYTDTLYVPSSRSVSAGAGLAGGGALSADVTLNVGAGTGISVAADTVSLNTGYTNNLYASKALTLTAGAGLAGGGDLSAPRTFDIGAGAGITVSTDAIALDTAYTDSRYIPASRTVSAGAGLVGGGALSANLSFDVGAGPGIIVAADTVSLDTAFISTIAPPATRAVIAGTGLTGGGDLTADITLNVGAGTGISVAADTVSLNTGYTNNLYASKALVLTAGAGLVGGGDLSVPITFDIGAGAGIVVGADNISLDTVFTDGRYMPIGAVSGIDSLTDVDTSTALPVSGQGLMWDGVSQWRPGNVTDLAQTDARYVNIDGDTMTGFLTLNAEPTAPLHAATKSYADTKITGTIQMGLVAAAPAAGALPVGSVYFGWTV